MVGVFSSPAAARESPSPTPELMVCSSTCSSDGYVGEEGDIGVLVAERPLKESRNESRCCGDRRVSGVHWRSMMALSFDDCSVIREKVGC